MPLQRVTRYSLTGLVWAVLEFGLASPVAAQFYRPFPCADALVVNQTISYWWNPSGTPPQPPLLYEFYWGTGDEDEEDYAMASASAIYQFGTIISQDGGGELDNAYIGATCFQAGKVMYGTDTTWLPQQTYSTPGGDFQFHEIADEYTDGGTDEASDGGVIYCDYDVYYDDEGTEYDVATDCWEEYAT